MTTPDGDPPGTIEAITVGFGRVMADVGLLIGCGVLAAPVARRIAIIGRNGPPLTASSLGCGIFAGSVVVISGLAATSIAGLLDIKLGDLFQADEGAPLVLSILLAWFIAAVLHLAIGSVSVVAIRWWCRPR